MSVDLLTTEIGQINCPTSTQAKTKDGLRHEMGKWYLLSVLPEGAKPTMANNLKALSETYAKAERITAGEEIVIKTKDGKEVWRGKATNDIPKLNEPIKGMVKKTVKNAETGKDEEVEVEAVVGIFHGNNFSTFFPGVGVDKDGEPRSIADMLDAFNRGTRQGVANEGSYDITQEFKAGDGKQGRQMKGPDFSKAG